MKKSPWSPVEEQRRAAGSSGEPLRRRRPGAGGSWAGARGGIEEGLGRRPWGERRGGGGAGSRTPAVQGFSSLKRYRWKQCVSFQWDYIQITNEPSVFLTDKFERTVGLSHLKIHRINEPMKDFCIRKTLIKQ